MVAPTERTKGEHSSPLQGEMWEQGCRGDLWSPAGVRSTPRRRGLRFRKSSPIRVRILVRPVSAPLQTEPAGAGLRFGYPFVLGTWGTIGAVLRASTARPYRSAQRGRRASAARPYREWCRNRSCGGDLWSPAGIKNKKRQAPPGLALS